MTPGSEPRAGTPAERPGAIRAINGAAIAIYGDGRQVRDVLALHGWLIDRAGADRHGRAGGLR